MAAFSAGMVRKSIAKETFAVSIAVLFAELTAMAGWGSVRSRKGSATHQA
jgi:hypothetical protein